MIALGEKLQRGFQVVYIELIQVLYVNAFSWMFSESQIAQLDRLRWCRIAVRIRIVEQISQFFVVNFNVTYESFVAKSRIRCQTRRLFDLFEEILADARC